MGFGSWAGLILLCASMPLMTQQGTASPNQRQATADRDHPTFSRRPAPPPGSVPEGKIKLDVLVTDAAGQPVAGLEQRDFTLLDDNKPREIRSFQAVDGSAGKVGAGDPPVQVILLIDATNNSLHNLAFERSQIEKFLRQNGGHVAQPVTLEIFSEQGVQVQPQPSSDGNQMAQSLHKSGATMHVVQRGSGYDAIERVDWSLKTLQSIAAVEAPKPGRKMLIWIGPGWPMLEGPGYRASDATQRSLFNAIVETTRILREARITMYNVNPPDPESPATMRTSYYKTFLRGVRSAHETDSGDLSVPVFATHSGGLVLNTAGDLVSQLNRCVADAKAYYTLGFEVSAAERTDEYHSLEVKLDKAGAKARTNAGYYAEPVFRP